MKKNYWNGYDEKYKISLPTMEDYRNFANTTFSAGTVYNSSPMSITNTKTAIDSGKPIMGNWWSGASDKDWHATIITGYQQTTSTLIYYLKNPWWPYRQVITVTGSNLVYVDYGHTWNLYSSVH